MKKRMWGTGVATITTIFLPSPLSFTTPHLSNYGVRNRTIAPSVLSTVVSMSPVSQDLAYHRLSALIPYIHSASRTYNIPPNVLAAVLYEEVIHRKPVDLRTFGVAQLGVEELRLAGLSPDPSLLDDDSLSVRLLAAKLRRLQNQTGSLRDAITLHNGYSDYHKMVAESAKSIRLLTLLNTQNVYSTVVT